jgi:hypothetical protein
MAATAVQPVHQQAVAAATPAVTDELIAAPLPMDQSEGDTCPEVCRIFYDD